MNDIQQLDKVSLHFRSFCLLEEYREAQDMMEMIQSGWESEYLKMNETENFQIQYILSFAKKMTEGSNVVSDKPDKEVFMDFNCTAAEYAATFKCFNHIAVSCSQLPDLIDEYADMAILINLFCKRLKEGLLVPDIEILLQTDDAVYLKDLNNGKISITDSAEFVSQYYADCGRIFYVDTQNEWAEIIHDCGAFQRFAPVLDRKILRNIARRAIN
jgi:hypothetical protein